MKSSLSVSRAKKTHEAALQKLGRGLIKKYELAKMDITKNGRYIRAKEEIEKALAKANEKPHVHKKPNYAKPVKRK